MLRDILTLSALILVVLLVRAIFKNRVPKRMIYALWLVVLLKLCLPGTLFSLPVLPAEKAATLVQSVELPAQTAPVIQQPAQTGFPGTGNRETGCKAVNDGTDSPNCLVQRQRIARTLAVRRVGGVYDSAAP